MNVNNKPKYTWFTQQDFSLCVPKCKIGDMDHEAMLMFDQARTIARVPFKVNSAYRTPDYEQSKGRSRTGAHTTRTAMDISAPNSRIRFRVIEGLVKAGFKRIGIYATFIHADNDSNKPQEVLFFGDNTVD
jgi:uncharacterized protein YcbK (DUF882 family)